MGLRHEPKWLALAEFTELYGIDKDVVYVAKSSKRLPKEMFSKVKKALYLDTNYIDRRINMRRKFFTRGHEVYYELLELVGGIQRRISLLMCIIEGNMSKQNIDNWNMWMSGTQFRPLNDSFILTIRPKDYLFVRYGRWLLALERRQGTGYLNQLIKENK